MPCAHLRGIPLSRHLEKFSQIFRAERLLATHCLSTVCEFASRAIHKRRRKSKKIDMPALGYPSRMKGGHEKTPEVTTPTLPLGFCPVDQESGAHTTRQTGRCVGIAEREIHGFYRKKECATMSSRKNMRRCPI